MEIAKISAKGQTTIPAAIRSAAHLSTGDTLVFEVKGDHLIVRKVQPPSDDYLSGLSNTLTEWSSSEDEDAWNAL